MNFQILKSINTLTSVFKQHLQLEISNYMGLTGAVHCCWYLWRYSTFGWNEGQQSDRGDQQRPRGAHLPSGRLRASRRFVQGTNASLN